MIKTSTEQRLLKLKFSMISQVLLFNFGIHDQLVRNRSYGVCRPISSFYGVALSLGVEPVLILLLIDFKLLASVHTTLYLAILKG